MKTSVLIAAALLTAAQAHAIDYVRLMGGGSELGDIVSVSKDGVVLEQAAGEKRIAAPDIKMLILDGEPTQLTQAKTNAVAGGYKTALERLADVQLPRDASALMKQELAFYLASCRAQEALAGAGDVGEATAKLAAFARSARDGLHFYATVETLGDLAVVAGRTDRADPMYAALAKAPFAKLKVRALVKSGLAAQAAGDHGKAIKRFDAAIDRGRGVPSESFRATLSKAVSLAATGRVSESETLIAFVLADADPEDEETLAAAYNAWGRACDAADRPRDALYAYLHTDLLFDGVGPSHAEALARLAELWRAVGKPDAASDARDRLRRQYPSTKWARAAG